MLATDVEPDRLAAAKQAAARGSSTGCPTQFNVGLVAFAGTASVVVPPSTDRDGAARRASTGWPRAPPGCRAPRSARPSSPRCERDPQRWTPRPREDPPPARIVLLSDGANTSGRGPDEAAGGGGRRPGAGRTRSRSAPPAGTVDRGGRTDPVPVDGETLRAVAEETGGGYHEAGSSDELREVYDDIGSSVGYRTERQDISARFIGLGLVLAMAPRPLAALVLPPALTRTTAAVTGHVRSDAWQCRPDWASPADPGSSRPELDPTGGRRRAYRARTRGPARRRAGARPAAGRRWRWWRSPPPPARSAGGVVGRPGRRDRAPRAAAAAPVPAELVAAAAAGRVPGVVSVHGRRRRPARRPGSGFASTTAAHRHQRPRRGQGGGGAVTVELPDGRRLAAEVVGRDAAQRHRGAAGAAVGRAGAAAAGQAGRRPGSASRCWRSARRSGCPARSPPASSARSTGRYGSATAGDSSACRPTPRSTRATPAARWSTPRGEVVGVNTAIATLDGSGSIGIGFAIPIDQVQQTADTIIGKGG